MPSLCGSGPSTWPRHQTLANKGRRDYTRCTRGGTISSISSLGSPSTVTHISPTIAAILLSLTPLDLVQRATIQLVINVHVRVHR